jgi:hypothetical protein
MSGPITEESGPENPEDRRAARPIGVGGILGPRAEEIAAAAQSLGDSPAIALERLAASGRFRIARPRKDPDKFGAEHDVFLAADGLRVVKHARNYGFGPAVADGGLIMSTGTPCGYLVRHALLEQVFPTGITVEGLTEDGHFVISQRAIKGNHPTDHAIRKYLSGIGFVNVPARFGQGGAAWFHRGLGVLIMDTAADNFIAAKQGIVPIDLQIAELEGELLELAAAVDSLAQQAPRIGL